MARTGVRSLSHGIVPSLSDLAAPGKRIGTPHDMRPPTPERIALPDPAIEVWLACLDADADQVAPRVIDFTAATQRVSDWALHAADLGDDYVATVAAYRGESLVRK